MRVSFLERALKPAKKAARHPEQLNQDSRTGRSEATRKAMSEYHRKKWLDFYLRNPNFVAPSSRPNAKRPSF